MRLLSVILVAFFAFFEVVKCGDNVHGNLWSRRHNPKVDVAAAQQNTALEKRIDGAKFTFYAAGLGACGIVNTASDFVSFSLYEILLKLATNRYVDRCSQCCCKTRLWSLI